MSSPEPIRACTLAIVIASGLLVTAACGARGPLDDSPIDAGADAALAPAEGGSEAGEDAGPDGGRTGLLACGQCLSDQCGGSVLACLQAPACRTTVQCIATTCLPSGRLDLGCLTGCASGNTTGALAAFEVFDCATRTCGGDCASILGAVLDGLGGLGGGGGGGPRDGGRPPGGGGDAAP